MTQLPENEVTQSDLETWFILKKQLSDIKAAEMLLRMKIYKGKFVHRDPDGNEIFPKEGTTSLSLADGYVLKAQRVISRDIDKGTFEVLKDVFRAKGINPDVMVEYKPSLKLSEYRTLTEDQRTVFDQALIVKDGSPQLEIMRPKRAPKE